MEDASASTDIMKTPMEIANPARIRSANYALPLELIAMNVSRMLKKMPKEFANAWQDSTPAMEPVFSAQQPVLPAHQPPTVIPVSTTKTPEVLLTLAANVWMGSTMMESMLSARCAAWSATLVQGPTSTA